MYYRDDTRNEWIQKGDDIHGEAANDYSGWSVSLNYNGTILAIGSTHNDNGGTTNSGHVRVFEWKTSGWTKIGNNITNSQSSQHMGNSVSLNYAGNIVACGAFSFSRNYSNLSNSGTVFIYKWNGIDSWNKKGEAIYGVAAGDEFGYSVSLSHDGRRVAVGTWEHDGEDKTDSGQVRIFEWNVGINNWKQIGQSIYGVSAGDRSGECVSLNTYGNIVAIAARYNDGNGDYSGHVRVYEWNGSV